MPIYQIQPERSDKTFEVDAASVEEAKRTANAFLSQRGGQDRNRVLESIATFGRNAPQRAEFALQAGRDIGAGVAEIPARLAAGARQTGAALSDALGLVLQGRPYRGGDIRLGDGTIIRGGELETSAFKRETANEILRRATVSAQQREEGIDPAVAGRVSGLGEILVAAIAPEVAIPGRAVTMVGAAARNAATAASGSAILFDAENNKLDDPLWGAAGSIGIGLFPSLNPAVRNAIGRSINRAVEEGNTARRVESAGKALPNVRFSLAQILGIPEVQTLQRAAYNSQLVRFYADQTDNFVRDFVRNFRGMRERIGPTTAATRAGMVQSLRNLRRNADTAYEKAMEEAAELSSRVKTPAELADPRDAVRRERVTLNNASVDDVTAKAQRRAAPGPTGARIPLGNFREQLRVLQAEATDSVRIGGTPILSPKLLSGMERTMDEQGTVSVKDFSLIMRELSGKLAPGADPRERALARKLRASIETDLDAVERLAGATTNDAVLRVLEGRAEYRRAKQIERALSEHAAYKLMGIAKTQDAPLPASTLLARFEGLDEGSRAQAAEFFREHYPEMGVALKREAVRSAVQASGTIRAAADSQRDVLNLMNRLFDKDTGFALRTRGLWSAKELATMESIKDGIRVMLNLRPEFRGSGTPIKPEDIAINVVSRSGEFVARLAARIWFGARGADFFTDPRIASELLRINRSATGTPTNTLARAAFLEYMQNEYLDEGTERQTALTAD